MTNQSFWQLQPVSSRGWSLWRAEEGRLFSAGSSVGSTPLDHLRNALQKPSKGSRRLFISGSFCVFQIDTPLRARTPGTKDRLKELQTGVIHLGVVQRLNRHLKVPQVIPKAILIPTILGPLSLLLVSHHGV
jgi:hypothetical protein